MSETAMPELNDDPTRCPGPSRKILQAASQLYREIGHRKTTVSDIARRSSMSPANVYRFFPSKRAIEAAVVAELFEEVSMAATGAAQVEGSAVERLNATLKMIAQLNEELFARHGSLHELMAVAVRESWPVALSSADRIRGLVRHLIVAGQESGELRAGSPMALACCLLEAMDVHLSPSRIRGALRPSFDEMMRFCVAALRDPRSQPAQVNSDLRLKAVG